MKNSPAIRKAIRAYMDAQGLSARALAEKIGCTNTAASRWIAEAGIQTGSISPSHWCKLYPLIRQYLPAEYTTVEGSAFPQEPRTVVPAPPDKHVVPVLGAAAAAGYEPALEPLDGFLAAFEDDTESWPENEPYKPGYFCLRVEGDSMSPVIPHGATLYVAAGEFPERGDTVVARLADQGEVVVKQYHRKNGVVELRAVNPAGKGYEIDIKAEPGRIMWMFPVVEVRVNLRRQRWEQAKGNGKA